VLHYDATAITPVTVLQNQSYLVGTAAIYINAPTYSWVPVDAYATFTYAFVGSPPSFVTLTSPPVKIKVLTSDLTKLGAYPITIRTTETNSGLTHN
jgi:hypothetical protein